MNNTFSSLTSPTAAPAQWVKPAMTATSLRDALSGGTVTTDGTNTNMSS